MAQGAHVSPTVIKQCTHVGSNNWAGVQNKIRLCLQCIQSNRKLKSAIYEFLRLFETAEYHYVAKLKHEITV